MIGIVMAAGPLAAQTASAQTVSGAAVYQQRCAQCHENAATNRAPSRDALQKMPASRILQTLDFGLMMGVAYPLTREERTAVANYAAKNFTAVNGVEAKGGSLDGAGPMVAGGMLFVNSGYPRTGGMAGNVLLAFAPGE